jgi:hypothetical protein
VRRAAVAVLAIGLAVAPSFARDARAVATAVDDPFYVVDEDETLLVDAPGVLDNDTDDGGAPLCVVDVDDTGLKGTLDPWGADGSFTFSPKADFNGETTFTYGVRAGEGECVGEPDGEATVTITVNPVNDAPTAKADAFQALRDRTLNVAAPGVLLNDADIDGDDLVAQKVTDPAHGIVNLSPNGAFSYTPLAGYVGPDGFSYRASDGSDTSPVRVVSITVTAVPTPAPTIAPTPTPAPPVTPAPQATPTASPEPSASPGASASTAPVPSGSPLPSPVASLGPGDPANESGGLSIPVLVVGLLLASLLTFGGAMFLPKWLEQRRAGAEPPPDDVDDS